MVTVAVFAHTTAGQVNGCVCLVWSVPYTALNSIIPESVSAKLVARVLSGRSTLPSQVEMAEDTQRLYKLYQDKNVPVRYFFNQVPSPLFSLSIV
jgi:hypothetical protein